MGDLVGKQLHIVLISHELSLPTERPFLPHLSLKGSPRWNMGRLSRNWNPTEPSH